MRKEEIRAGHYYHLYNRGVDRQPIFFAQPHWAYFITRLRQYFLPESVEILAYCLMPNHYHLLIRTHCDDLGQRVLHPFSISYTKSINKERQRVGPLFQGPYQIKLVDEDRHLRHLSRYIHVNPVQATLVKQPEDWIFSSYRDYIGIRQGTLPKPTAILAQFPSAQAYADYVNAYKPQDQQSIAHLTFAE